MKLALTICCIFIFATQGCVAKTDPIVAAINDTTYKPYVPPTLEERNRAIMKSIRDKEAAKSAKTGWPQYHQLGEYNYKLSKEGIGRFGRELDQEIFDDNWYFSVTKDAISDEKSVSITRTMHFRQKTITSLDSVGLQVKLTDPEHELVCVSGHDFPGEVAAIRVDSAEAIYSGKCTELTDELEAQMRDGEAILVEGYVWPEGLARSLVSLDGFAELLDLVRSMR